MSKNLRIWRLPIYVYVRLGSAVNHTLLHAPLPHQRRALQYEW